jgi:hypothetical protein
MANLLVRLTLNKQCHYWLLLPFFGETELAQECLNPIIESLATLEAPEMILHYVQFSESNYGELTTDLMDALFLFLCRLGCKEEIVPIIAKLPEEWFQSIISSDYFFARCEWERYKIYTANT